MIRAVIDANVWISGLLTPLGPASKVIEAVRVGRIVAVVSEASLTELAGVLSRPRFAVIGSDAIESLLVLLRSEAELVEVRPAPRPWTRDPDDDYLVELAIAGRAAIITGDQDILQATLPVPALTPRAFINELERG